MRYVASLLGFVLAVSVIGPYLAERSVWLTFALGIVLIVLGVIIVVNRREADRDREAGERKFLSKFRGR